jgi:hypothetical protein
VSHLPDLQAAIQVRIEAAHRFSSSGFKDVIFWNPHA